MGSKPSHVESNNKSRQPTDEGKQLAANTGLQSVDNPQPQSISQPHRTPAAATSGAAKATESSPSPPTTANRAKAETPPPPLSPPPLSPPPPPLPTASITTSTTETYSSTAAANAYDSDHAGAAAAVAVFGGSESNGNDSRDAGASVFLTEPGKPIKPGARWNYLDDVDDNGTNDTERYACDDEQKDEDPKNHGIATEDRRGEKSRDGKKRDAEGKDRKEGDYATATWTESVTKQQKLTAQSSVPDEIKFHQDTKAASGRAEQSGNVREEESKRKVCDFGAASVINTEINQDISLESNAQDKVIQEDNDVEPDVDGSGGDKEGEKSHGERNVLSHGVVDERESDTDEVATVNGSDLIYVVNHNVHAGTIIQRDSSLGHRVGDHCSDDETQVNGRKIFLTDLEKVGEVVGEEGNVSDGEKNAENDRLHDTKDSDEAQESAKVDKYLSEHRGSIHFRLVTFLTDEDQHIAFVKDEAFRPPLITARRDSLQGTTLSRSPSSSPRKRSSRTRKSMDHERRGDRHHQEEVPVGKKFSPEVIIKTPPDISGGLSPDQPTRSPQFNGIDSEERDKKDHPVTASKSAAEAAGETEKTDKPLGRKRSSATKLESATHDETQQSQTPVVANGKRPPNTRGSTSSFGRVRLASRKSESSLQGAESEPNGSRKRSSQTRTESLSESSEGMVINGENRGTQGEESAPKPPRGITSAAQNQETPARGSARPGSQTSRGSTDRTRPLTRDKSGSSLSRIASAREKPEPPQSEEAVQDQDMKSTDTETSASSRRQPASKGRPLSRDSGSSFGRVRSAKRKPEFDSSASEELGVTSENGSLPPSGAEPSSKGELTGDVTSSTESDRRERAGSPDDKGRQGRGQGQGQQQAASSSSSVREEEEVIPSRPKGPGARFDKPSFRRMEELDNHVLNTPKQLDRYQPYQLVEYLLSVTRTEVEAAYAIFRWVTCLPVPAKKKGRIASKTPEGEEKKNEEVGGEDETTVVSTLATYEEQLKQGIIDHADMFSILCKYANLETHKVTGKVRFYCPQPSAHLCRTRRASWSAILLPGGWGHVDCSLGSRHWAVHRRPTHPSVTSASSSSPYPLGGASSGHIQASSQGKNRTEDGLVEAASGSAVQSGGAIGEADGTDSSCGVDGQGSAGDDNVDGGDGRAVSGESSKRGGVVPDNDAARFHEHAPHNFYFLPTPEMLVSSHLPGNPRWQLLPVQVSEADFDASNLLKPQLYYLNVELVCPTSIQIKDIAKETDVVWKFKGEELRRFAFRLFHVTNNGLSCEQLTRYGFLENHLRKKEATLRLIPPCAGRFVCELFGTYLQHGGNEMVHMASFDLKFTETITNPLQFPRNPRAEWGPGAECVALGLKPLSHDTGCINVDGGEAEVIFRSTRPVLVTQKLLAVVPDNYNNEKDDDDERGDEERSPRSSSSDEGTVEVPHSTVNFRDIKNRVKILLRIPEAGDYVLAIYAKDESAPGKCQLICNYLVLCDSGTPEVVHPFPSLPYNKLGQTKAFTDFGMRLVCPKKSPIVVAPYSGKVTFVYTIIRPDTPSADDAKPGESALSAGEVELSCDLHHLGKDGGETTDAAEYVQHTGQAGESVFRARLPEAGDYLFYLYGRLANGEGHKFLLYTALVECAVPNKDCLPLPRVVPDWRSRVHILAPLRKFLVLGAVTHFAVRAYNVKAMAVVGQSGTQAFINEDEEEDEESRQEDRGFVENGDGENMYDNAYGVRSEVKENVSSANENDARDDESRRVDADTENSQSTKGKVSASHETGNAEKTSSLEHAQASRSDRAKKRGRHHGNEEGGEEEEEDEEEEEETDEGWQVWKCSVKVEREDEGSGVRLCVQTARESSMACVAEFEVITERNMAARLDHQHSVWAAEEANFKVRPDSGHRSHLDDEETQSAYFLDDEVYLSNPLGDENSDDNDSDDVSSDEDIFTPTSSSDEGGDGDFVRDDISDDDAADAKDDDDGTDDTRVDRSGSSGFGAAGTSSSEVSHRQQEKGEHRKSGDTLKSKKAKNDKRNSEFKRSTFHPSLVYGVSQSAPRSQATHRDKHAKGGDSRGRGKGEANGQGGEASAPSKRSRRNKDKKTTESDFESSESKEKVRHKGSKDTYFSDDPNRQDGAGSKERSLRRKLWNACQRREREAIEKAVARYTRGGYPPCADLAAAERLLHLFRLRDDLIQALDSKDTGAIRTALTEVERHGYAGEMSVVCRKAHALLSPHRARGTSSGVVEADLRTLLEIRSYRCPPEVIRRVMAGVLLLIGFHEGLTKNWKGCRRRLHVLGPDGIQRKMTKVKVETIHPEIAARADELLDPDDMKGLQSVGPGVVAVYNWARDVITSAKSLEETHNSYSHNSAATTTTTNNSSKKKKEKDPPPIPASKRRQREIFKEQRQQQEAAGLATADSHHQTDKANADTDSAKTSSRHNAAAGDATTKSGKHAARGKSSNDTPRLEKQSGKETKGKPQQHHSGRGGGGRGGGGAELRSGIHHTAGEGGRHRQQQQQQKKDSGTAGTGAKGSGSGGAGSGSGEKRSNNKPDPHATNNKRPHQDKQQQKQEHPTVNVAHHSSVNGDAQNLADDGHCQHQQGKNPKNPDAPGENGYSESLFSDPSTTNAVCGSYPSSVKSSGPARTPNPDDEGENDQESGLLPRPADPQDSASCNNGGTSGSTRQQGERGDGKDNDDRENVKNVFEKRPPRQQKPNLSPERTRNNNNTDKKSRSEPGKHNRSPERGPSNGFVHARSGPAGGRYKSPERGPSKTSNVYTNNSIANIGGYPDKRRRPNTDPTKARHHPGKSPERARNPTTYTNSGGSGSTSNTSDGGARRTTTTATATTTTASTSSSSSEGNRRPQQVSAGMRGPGGEGRGRGSARVAPAPSHPARWGEPTEPLTYLSPRKSPLFRPANRGRNSRGNGARPRSSLPGVRPRTTPAPVMQSTFFFASVVKKKEEEEQVDGEEEMMDEFNDNKAVFTPHHLQNHRHQHPQQQQHPPAQQQQQHQETSAPGPAGDSLAAAVTDGISPREKPLTSATGAAGTMRVGENVGDPKHHHQRQHQQLHLQQQTPNGGRHISEMATPDI